MSPFATIIAIAFAATMVIGVLIAFYFVIAAPIRSLFKELKEMLWD